MACVVDKDLTGTIKLSAGSKIARGVSANPKGEAIHSKVYSLVK